MHDLPSHVIACMCMCCIAIMIIVIAIGLYILIIIVSVHNEYGTCLHIPAGGYS